MKCAAFIFSLVGASAVFTAVFASHGVSNIDSASRWAWNETIGWLDFHYYDNVVVAGANLTGYASSSVGQIVLNCSSLPGGSNCAGAAGNWFVSNDGSGNLAGWAWNDAIGWVGFCGNGSGGSTYSGGAWVCPASPTYQVTINTSTGDFSGWAWNDVLGWISFNCSNAGTCGSVSYKTNTTWRPGAPPSPGVAASGTLISSTYETSYYSVEGAALNSILWQGTLGSSSTVKFQVASSNCPNGETDYPVCTTGSWNYLGSDGTASTYYFPAGPDIAAPLKIQNHNNKRYFRYKIFLDIGAGGSSPEVQDVIINWSP